MATSDNPAFKVINYYNGDTISKSYAVADSAGNPVDLSGMDLIFTLKKKKTGVVIESLTSASGIVISGADNDIFTLTLNFDLDLVRYFHDLYNITGDYTLMYGPFNVTMQVNDG